MGRIILSICAVVVAVGLAGLSPPHGDAGGIQAKASQERAQAQKPATTEEGEGGPELHAACDPGEDNRRSDLCAQWKAADSAAESAVWTRWTGKFTGAGLLIGFVTMVAAICAAVFAALASGHTKRSADIAGNALIADTRAWLAIRTVSVKVLVDRGDDGSVLASPHLTAWVENYGNGPAINCVLEYAWRRPGMPWETVQDFEDAVRAVSFDSLMPKTYDANIQHFWNEKLDDIWCSGLLQLWVRVSYQTVSEEKPRTTTQRIDYAERNEPLSVERMDRESFEAAGQKNLKGRVIRTEMT